MRWSLARCELPPRDSGTPRPAPHFLVPDRKPVARLAHRTDVDPNHGSWVRGNRGRWRPNATLSHIRRRQPVARLVHLTPPGAFAAGDFPIDGFSTADGSGPRCPCERRRQPVDEQVVLPQHLHQRRLDRLPPSNPLPAAVGSSRSRCGRLGIIRPPRAGRWQRRPTRRDWLRARGGRRGNSRARPGRPGRAPAGRAEAHGGDLALPDAAADGGRGEVQPLGGLGDRQQWQGVLTSCHAPGVPIGVGVMSARCR